MRGTLVSKWYSFLSKSGNTRQEKLMEISKKDLTKTRLKSYLSNKTTDQLEHIFNGNLRFVENLPTDGYGERDSQLLDYIRDIKRLLGWNVDLGEPFGYATKTVQSVVGDKVYNNKKRVKIGPLFKELGPEAEEFWVKHAKFYTTKENLNYFSSEYSLVYSRAPIDILRMSDMDNWSSCHNVEGSYFKCAIEEAVGGGAIVYVVKKSDLEGVDLQSPEIFIDKDRKLGSVQALARLRIRRLEISEEGGVELGIPEIRTYGYSFPQLYNRVRRLLLSKQEDIIERNSDEGIIDLSPWRMTGGTYEDNDVSNLLDRFFEGTKYGYKGYNTSSKGIGETEATLNKIINEILPIINDGAVSSYAQVLGTNNPGGEIEFYSKIFFEVSGYYKDFESRSFRSEFVKMLKNNLPGTSRNLFSEEKESEYVYSKKTNMSKITFILSYPDTDEEYSIENFRFFAQEIETYIINQYKSLTMLFVQSMRTLNQIPNNLFKLDLKHFDVLNQNGSTIIRLKTLAYVGPAPRFQDLDISKIPGHLVRGAEAAFIHKFEPSIFKIKLGQILPSITTEIYESFFKQKNFFGQQKNLGIDNQHTLSHEKVPKGNIPKDMLEIDKWMGDSVMTVRSLSSQGSIYYNITLVWYDGISPDGNIKDPGNFIMLCKFLDRNYAALRSFIVHKYNELAQEEKEKFVMELSDQIKKNPQEIKYSGMSTRPLYGQDKLPELEEEPYNFFRDVYRENKKKTLKENQSKIKYKTDNLEYFLQTYRGIKQLRVPSWYLQMLYSHEIDEDAMAVVAFDGWKPVAISTLSLTGDEIDGEFVSLVNLYVQPEYRGKGIASQMFKKIEKVSSGFKYIEAGRRTAEMLKSRGYKEISYEPMDIAGGIAFLNKNYKQ